MRSWRNFRQRKQVRGIGRCLNAGINSPPPTANPSSYRSGVDHPLLVFVIPNIIQRASLRKGIKEQNDAAWQHTEKLNELITEAPLKSSMKILPPAYHEAMRLRKIWCEGNFSHQKSSHNLRRVLRRGLGNAQTHCLLSAIALNLKRLVALMKQHGAGSHIHDLLRRTLQVRFGGMDDSYAAFYSLLSTAPKRSPL